MTTVLADRPSLAELVEDLDDRVDRGDPDRQADHHVYEQRPVGALTELGGLARLIHDGVLLSLLAAFQVAWVGGLAYALFWLI
ncbi:MAG: hypothetical protein QOG69_1502 [Actinomycetota bacterium]|nr:hypothetical protein [Actinomycetota bacterium]